MSLESKQVILADMYQRMRAIPYYPHYRGADRTEYLFFPNTSEILYAPTNRLCMLRHEDGRIELQISGPSRTAHLDLATLNWDGFGAELEKSIKTIPFADGAITKWNGSLRSLDRWNRYTRKQARLWAGRPSSSEAGWFRQHVFGMVPDMAAYANEQDRNDRCKRQRAMYIRSHKHRKPKRG